MSNTLTALAPTLFSTARVVPRELVGVLGAIRLDWNDQGVAVGDSVKIPVVPALTAGSFTAAQTFTAGTDRVLSSKTLTLSQTFETSWNLTSEEDRSLMNGGQNAVDVFAQTMEQAWRLYVNTVDAYMWGIARKGASRAYGTAATTPFASDLTAAGNIKKILDDNGTPMGDRSLILNTAAGLKLRSLTPLTKVNEAGDSAMLREGALGRLFGFDIREDGQIGVVTAGTGSGYLINNGNVAVGSTDLTVDTGSGTILAGDIITHASDSVNKYVVTSALTGDTALSIGEPGLKTATANNDAITVGAAFTANLALHRQAVVCAARPLTQPAGGIADSMIVSDAQTGLSALIVRAVGSGMTSWYMRAAYDGFVPNTYGVAVLLG